VQALLQKIYMASFRVNDILTLLQPQDWKVGDAERKSFGQTLDLLRQQLKTLEEFRNQFLAQPQNTDLGDKTVAAMNAVRMSTDAVARAVAQYDDRARSAEFRQSEEQVSTLQQSLESYLASLRLPAERQAATATPVATPATEQPGQPGAPSSTAVQTETIEAPTAAPPPATTAETPDSMRVYQAKVLLHKLYVATFRVNDLLSLADPERWKIPQPLRASFNQEVGVLRKQISALDAARVQFETSPDDAYLGFQTYVAIAPVIDGVSRVSRDVAQYEGPAAGRDFVQPAQWLGETRQDLLAYVSSVLQNRELAIHGYQADLATCQNTLNYALRPKAAAPMPNFMPILKGVRHVRRATKTAAHTVGGKEKKKVPRGRASGQ
jgi:hypothetical protein